MSTHNASSGPKQGAEKTMFPDPITGPELLAKEFPERRFLVPRLIREKGIHGIAGRPKNAKTPLVMQLGLSVAEGEPWCDGADPSEQAEVLHMGLERGEEVLQQQLKDQLNGRSCPKGFHVVPAWQRLDKGGAVRLDNWLKDHPAVKLVTFDIWASIVPRKDKKGGVDSYHEDYSDFEILRELIRRHGVAFLFTHHANQGKDHVDFFASFYGNTGLAGAVDMGGLLKLNKDKTGTLKVQGTFLSEETRNLKFVYPHWGYRGGADDVPEPNAGLYDDLQKDKNAQLAGEVLRSFGAHGATFSEWQAGCLDFMSKRTFATKAALLVRVKLVEKRGDKYHIAIRVVSATDVAQTLH